MAKSAHRPSQENQNPLLRHQTARRLSCIETSVGITSTFTAALMRKWESWFLRLVSSSTHSVSSSYNIVSRIPFLTTEIVIGLTLVVAGDSFFLTLFAVILFHQMFEGIALGTCIAGLPSTKASLLQKSLMATAFSLITPIGMAIGIGVLDHFNGNDPSTLIAIGTLDALSAGILAWVGLVEMLARDWLHGPLLNAGMVKTGAAMAALLAGMILMSVLGKWA